MHRDPLMHAAEHAAGTSSVGFRRHFQNPSTNLNATCSVTDQVFHGLLEATKTKH